MPDITPTFVMEYERRMRVIREQEYARRLLRENTWYQRVLRPTKIEGKTERITWFLDTATIVPLGPTGDGEMEFEGLVAQTVEYPTFKHGKGLKIQRDQLEDLDGTGLDQAAKWSENIGNETAYYPQRLASQAIMNAANTDGSANAYDGQPFFSDNTTNSGKAHPLNPFNTKAGGYCNWLHGSAGTSDTGPAGATQPYPGALPIDESVTTDVALSNLKKAWAYIKSIKMPNGIDPRFLTPKFIMGPPALAARISMLTDAKYIAQAAASGGGAADVQAYIKRLGFDIEPLVADELAASTSYTTPMPFMALGGAGGSGGTVTGGNTTFLNESIAGSDTTWYIVCEESQSSQLGALLHVMRKPFKVNYYTGDGGTGATGIDAILDRIDEFEYHCRGRMSVQLGHPYAIFRIDAS
jgi:hypothetical protein